LSSTSSPPARIPAIVGRIPISGLRLLDKVDVFVQELAGLRTNLAFLSADLRDVHVATASFSPILAFPSSIDRRRRASTTTRSAPNPRKQIRFHELAFQPGKSDYRTSSPAGHFASIKSRRCAARWSWIAVEVTFCLRPAELLACVRFASGVAIPESLSVRDRIPRREEQRWKLSVQSSSISGTWSSR